MKNFIATVLLGTLPMLGYWVGLNADQFTFERCPTVDHGKYTSEMVSAWEEWNDVLVTGSIDTERGKSAFYFMEQFDKDALVSLNAYGNARYEKGRFDALR